MRSALAWVITLLWVALYVRKIADPTFPVPAEVTPVMLLAAGYLFGTDIRSKLKDKAGGAVAKANQMLNEPEKAPDADNA